MARKSYFPAYSPNGAMSDAALAAALEDAVTRAKIEKKIPLTQITDRTMLAEVQKDMASERK